MGGMFIMLKSKREMYSLGSDVDNYLVNSRVIASANFHVTIPHETSTCPWTY